MRWECDGKQKERESGPRGEIAPAYKIDVQHHQPAWRIGDIIFEADIWLKGAASDASWKKG